MKAKNIALAVLVVGLLGAAIWRYARPTEVAPVIAAQAPIPAKAVVPPTAVVEPPKLPPVAASSSPPELASPEKAPITPHVFEGGITDAGTIEFLEGVPITVTLDNGEQCRLTASYEPTRDPSLKTLAILVEPLDPAAEAKIEGKGASTLNPIQNGKQKTLFVGDSELKLVPVIKTN